MPQTISKALYARLERSARFRLSLRDLHLLSGMECLLLDGFGNERLRFPREGMFEWRRIAATHPAVAELRTQYRLEYLSTGQCSFESPWQEVVHPMRIGSERVGYLVLSQYRPTEAGRGLAMRCWADLAKQGLAPPGRVWEAAWAELPALSAAQAYAWQRALQLQAAEAMRQVEQATPELPPATSLSPLVEAACEAVRQGFRGPVHLQDVAASRGVSAEHLSRSFHRSTGLRFREYLAETRINAVCKELEKTTDSVSEIALRCGFNALSRFNRCFKEVRGMTPREWRLRSRFKSQN
jgi:AraC-like DNA-binding protein